MSIESDLMARTLTVTVDSPYHWKFHDLPMETRYRIVGENVRIAEAFIFDPWPGATEPLQDTPWEEAQLKRQADYEKGRLISSEWNAFVTDIGTDEDYEIMDAELSNAHPLAVLELGVMNYSNSDYRAIRIHAEHFRFHVGAQEFSVEDFQEFGEAYWKHFAQRRDAASSGTQSE